MPAAHAPPEPGRKPTQGHPKNRLEPDTPEKRPTPEQEERGQRKDEQDPSSLTPFDAQEGNRHQGSERRQDQQGLPVHVGSIGRAPGRVNQRCLRL